MAAVEVGLAGGPREPLLQSSEALPPWEGRGQSPRPLCSLQQRVRAPRVTWWKRAVLLWLCCTRSNKGQGNQGRPFYLRPTSARPQDNNGLGAGTVAGCSTRKEVLLYIHLQKDRFHTAFLRSPRDIVSSSENISQPRLVWLSGFSTGL